MRMLAALSLAAIGAAAGMAGCGNGTTPAPAGSSAPPPAATTGAPSQVANCVVGSWQTTAVQQSAAAQGGSATVSGGAGVRLNVAADGAATLDFTSMQPVNFEAMVLGQNVKGSFTYAGEASTKVRTDSPSATSGTWQPAGSVDWSKVKVSADLTQPVQGKPLDNLPLRDYLGDKSSQTGGVVDIDPLLGKGTYTCEGSTSLTLTPENTKGLKWTLTKRP